MNRKEARIALRESIKHWCLDIRKNFLDGDTIDFNGEYWKKSLKIIKMHSDVCELCKVYYDRCHMCPLTLFSSKCDDRNSGYSIFRRDLNLKATNNMISLLVRCYKYVL